MTNQVLEYSTGHSKQLDSRSPNGRLIDDVNAAMTTHTTSNHLRLIIIRRRYVRLCLLLSVI